MTPFKAGLLALVLIGTFAYFGFTKINPFSDPYVLKRRRWSTPATCRRGSVRADGRRGRGQGDQVAPVPGRHSAAMVDDGAERGCAAAARGSAASRCDRASSSRATTSSICGLGRPPRPSSRTADTLRASQKRGLRLDAEVLGVLQSDVREDLRTLLFELGTKGLIEGGGAEGFNRAVPFSCPPT